MTKSFVIGAKVIFVVLCVAGLIYAWKSGALADLQQDMSRDAIERWRAQPGNRGTAIAISLMIAMLAD